MSDGQYIPSGTEGEERKMWEPDVGMCGLSPVEADQPKEETPGARLLREVEQAMERAVTVLQSARTIEERLLTAEEPCVERRATAAAGASGYGLLDRAADNVRGIQDTLNETDEILCRINAAL